MKPKDEDFIRFYRDAVIAGQDDPSDQRLRGSRHPQLEERRVNDHAHDHRAGGDLPHDGCGRG
jgi:hypothetical protein